VPQKKVSEKRQAAGVKCGGSGGSESAGFGRELAADQKDLEEERKRSAQTPL